MADIDPSEMKLADLRCELNNSPRKVVKRSTENPVTVAEPEAAAESEHSTRSQEKAAEADLEQKPTSSKRAKYGCRVKSVFHSSKKEAESEIDYPITEPPKKADESKDIQSNASESLAQLPSTVSEPTTQGAITNATVTESSTVEQPMYTGGEQPEPVDNGATEKFGRYHLPDSVMLVIFSYVPWQDQIKLEAVSTKWRNVLNDKSLRKIGEVDLALLVNGDISKLPQAMHSLLVNKRRIINSIIYKTDTNTHGHNIDTLNAVMPIFSSNRPEQLISLKLGNNFGSQQSEADEFSQFLNCFVNLKVLDLALGIVNRCSVPQTKIDLSQLKKLKELKGVRVQFVNCRAQNLAKMNLRNVKLRSTNDHIDFVQMMSSVAENIEVLHLVYVRLSNYSPPSDRQMDIKFPKLSDFNIYYCKLNGITVNLVESRCLKRLRVCYNYYCVITNFNLSIHCLEYFNIDLYYSGSDVISQFVASARADPQRLCLLEYLEIRNCSVSIVEVLDCFNPCFTYSLREFICDEQFTDSSGIIALIEHCPLLNCFCIDYTNDEVLIDLIIGTISLDIHVNGLCIKRGYNGLCFCVGPNFLSKLYNVLCLIDPMTMKCQNTVFVKVSDCASDLIGKIKDEFNIIFFSTEEQFKLEA